MKVFVGLIEGELYWCYGQVFNNPYGDCSYWDYLPLNEALVKYPGIKEY